jgi:hypothetical protein
MSKLDDIFDKFRSDCLLAQEAGLDISTNMLALSSISHKQQIKDWLFELTDPIYEAAYNRSDSDPVYKAMVALRQKVRES